MEEKTKVGTGRYVQNIGTGGRDARIGKKLLLVLQLVLSLVLVDLELYILLELQLGMDMKLLLVPTK